jgi:hypothetical protein
MCNHVDWRRISERERMIQRFWGKEFVSFVSPLTRSEEVLTYCSCEHTLDEQQPRSGGLYGFFLFLCFSGSCWIYHSIGGCDPGFPS